MKYVENKNRRVYNIDFDGTLTCGTYDEPKPLLSMVKVVRELYSSGHIIIIWTARLWEDASFVVSWLIRFGVPFHGIQMGKGGSDYYIDDKSMPIQTLLDNYYAPEA